MSAIVHVRNGFSEVIRQNSPESGITDTVRDARGLATQVTDGRLLTVTVNPGASQAVTSNSGTQHLFLAPARCITRRRPARGTRVVARQE